MSRRTGTVVAAVALWLAIVASTSTVAWVVIDRAGRGAFLTDGARPELTQADPGTATTPVTEGAPATASSTSPVPSRTRLPASSGGHPSTSRPPGGSPSPSTPTPRSTLPSPASTRPRSTPSPASTPRPTPKPPASSPAHPPAVVDDSVSVAGGSVGVSCQGAVLTLRFATPRNGWSYELDRSSTEIEVQFRQNGSEQESEVHARCSRGAPVFETSSSDAGSGRSSGTAPSDS